jgi:hypothetical protein
MPEPDELLLSPTDLHRKVPKFGLAFQRNHRKAGDFPIPHTQIGNRFFYRLSSVERFLAGQQEAKTAASGAKAPEPDDTLAATLAEILKTTPTGEETRKRIAELLGADESGERLWNGGTDDAA